LSLAFLPSEVERHKSRIKSKQSFAEEIGKAGQLALRASLWPLLAIKVLGGVASSMHQTALPMVLTQKLHYDPADLGFVMSASMFAVAAFGTVGMAPLIRRYNAQEVVRLGLVSRSFLVLLLSVVVSLSRSSRDMFSHVPVSMSNIMVSVASHALATSLTTLTTGAVERDEQGALLGLEHGLFSLARIGAPPLGAFLLASSGFSGVSVVCGLVDVGLVALLSAAAFGITSAPATSATTPSRKTKE
jgi:MFS family permease